MWGWNRHLGDRYNPFCSEPGQYWGLCAMGSADWPTFNTSVVLEAAREGIKDYRYLVTLERLAGERRDSPAGKEALGFLKDLRERIRPDLGHYLQQVGGERHGAGYWSFSRTDNAWSAVDYRRQRRAVAGMIAKLSR